MSLMNKIEDMQKKPEVVRKRVLFVSIFVIMFLVILIWISTLKFSIKSGADDKEKNVSNPFLIFRGITQDGLDIIFGKIKDAVGKVYGSQK